MKALSPFRMASVQIMYLLLVIVFGAWVRASGSGAGCGSHWPLCNGELVPADPGTATLIEYSHRLSSGLTLPLSLLVFWLLIRQAPSGHRARRAAFGTVLMVIVEGLVGAGLVLLGHVADNLSVYRAVSMSLHLLSTFTLMAFATLTWHWSRDLRHLPEKHSGLQLSPALPWSGLLALLLLGISGAVTALGDTLFPVSEPGDAWAMGMMGKSHLFVQLRIWHPFLAVAVGAWLIFLARHFAAKIPKVRALAAGLTWLILLQLCLGYLNIWLMAPVWLQLLHLLIAELIWISYILLLSSVDFRWTFTGRKTS